MKSFLQSMIRAYQLCISPLNPPSCRYIPSCSDYAITALNTHGVRRGLWMATTRLCRCHPWSRHALYDPVPGFETELHPSPATKPKR